MKPYSLRRHRRVAFARRLATVQEEMRRIREFRAEAMHNAALDLKKRDRKGKC